MKSFLALALLIVSATSYAASVSFKVKRFVGELKIEPAEVVIDKMSLVGRVDLCTIWDSECIGGKVMEMNRPIKFKNDSATNLVLFKAEEAIDISAFKIMDGFKSCTLSFHLSGVTPDGVRYSGIYELFTEGNKKQCESKMQVSTRLARKFSVPQRVLLVVE